MTNEKKIKTLKAAGWSRWYHPNNWVHQKTIEDPSIQDCTNYGMSLDEAYEFETQNKKPTPPLKKRIYNKIME